MIINTKQLSSLFTVTCKGICLRHKAQKPVGSGRYITGQKRCQGCDIFMKWEAIWCPCCGFKLRTRPRNSLFKKRLLLNGQIRGAETVVVRY
jgi:uncharacterized paraquat-inducible protein A